MGNLIMNNLRCLSKISDGYLGAIFTLVRGIKMESTAFTSAFNTFLDTVAPSLRRLEIAVTSISQTPYKKADKTEYTVIAGKPLARTESEIEEVILDIHKKSRNHVLNKNFLRRVAKSCGITTDESRDYVEKLKKEGKIEFEKEE